MYSQLDNFKDFSELPFELQGDIIRQSVPYGTSSLLSKSHSEYSRKYHAYENCMLTPISAKELLNTLENLTGNICSANIPTTSSGQNILDMFPITLSAFGYTKDKQGYNSSRAVFLSLTDIRSNHIIGSVTVVTIPEENFAEHIDTSFLFIEDYKVQLHKLTSALDVLVNPYLVDADIKMFGSSLIIKILLNRKVCMKLKQSYISDYISRTVESLVIKFNNDPFKLWLHLNILRMDLIASELDEYFTEMLSLLGSYGGDGPEADEIPFAVGEYNVSLINQIIETYKNLGHELDIQIPTITQISKNNANFY
jgi:hypothetical protein